MRSEREGQGFGIKCWKEGLSVEVTLEKAAKEIGLETLPDDPLDWPKFLHGAEEAWQDKNLAHLDEQSSLKNMKEKHVKAT